MIKNIYTKELFDWHFLVWKSKSIEFKCLKINNRFYIKYSLYFYNFIFEIGKLKSK